MILSQPEDPEKFRSIILQLGIPPTASVLFADLATDNRKESTMLDVIMKRLEQLEVQIQQSGNQAPRQQHTRTPTGRPTCWSCARPGHLARFCRDRNRSENEVRSSEVSQQR